MCGLVAVAQTPADTSTKPRVLKSVFGTVATDSVPVGPNSSRQKVGVPVPNNGSVKVGESELTTAGDSLAQRADTLPLSDRQNAAIRKIIPRKATLRSLMLPGLGQAYNRQFYKIPFIYAGFAATTYFIIRYTDNYNEYLAGYSEAYNSTLPAKTAIVRGQVRGVQQLKQASDFWRRNRDLNILLTVLLWGVQAVEANVAAHLKTFDISDDISATWKPAMLPSVGGMVPGVRLTFNFKH